MEYTAAVITVSDRCSRGEREDKSGPSLVELLKTDGWDVKYTSIVPDEKDEISAELIHCSDDLDIGLIVTTGGTGFYTRDVTPEATKAVIEREAPGIPEAMRVESMKITSKGCLSREAAGLRGGSLIINTPGSEKASRECIIAVLPALKHGVGILRATGSVDCATNK